MIIPFSSIKSVILPGSANDIVELPNAKEFTDLYHNSKLFNSFMFSNYDMVNPRIGLNLKFSLKNHSRDTLYSNLIYNYKIDVLKQIKYILINKYLII